jgi:hypothetical protein
VYGPEALLINHTVHYECDLYYDGMASDSVSYLWVLEAGASLATLTQDGGPKCYLTAGPATGSLKLRCKIVTDGIQIDGPLRDITIGDISSLPGAVNGAFPLSSGRAHYMARANLAYDTSDGRYKLNESQHDMIFTEEPQWYLRQDPTTMEKYDMFAPATVNAFFKSPNTTKVYVDGVETGSWFAPTSTQWQYLLEGRLASTVCGVHNARFVKCCIDWLKGLIILPCDYEHPSTVKDFAGINNKITSFTTNCFTWDEWRQIESAGAVFLPAAGYFSPTKEAIDNIFDYGYHALNTRAYYAGSNSKYLQVLNDNLKTDQGTSTNYRYTVRLAHE